MRYKIQLFRTALDTSGVLASLAVLNGGIAHRYTGVFRLDGDRLTNTHVFDKQGAPPPAGLSSVLLTDSFCQVVIRDGSLCMEDSTLDPRVAGSPYQGMVVAYHGVPIVGDDGELIGTLCHFDMCQQPLSDDEFECMQQAARLLGARAAQLVAA